VQNRIYIEIKAYKILLKFNLLPQMKHGLLFADFWETQIMRLNYVEIFVLNHRRRVINVESKDWKSFRPLTAL
jgi:hypothetical protein